MATETQQTFRTQAALEQWRATILQRMLWIAVVLGAFRALIVLFDETLNYLVLGYVLIVVMAFAPKISYRMRAGVLLGFMGFLAVRNLFVMGTSGGSMMWAILTIVLAGLLFGYKPGVRALLLYLMTIVIAAYCILNDVVVLKNPIYYDQNMLIRPWMRQFMNAAIGGGFLLISSMYLLGKLVESAETLEKRVDDRTRDLMLANEELSKALGEVKQLSGLLPICSGCKKVRDDDGYWQQVETFVADRSDADFSHGICPDCIKDLYPELERDKTA